MLLTPETKTLELSTPTAFVSYAPIAIVPNYSPGDNVAGCCHPVAEMLPLFPLHISVFHLCPSVAKIQSRLAPQTASPFRGAWVILPVMTALTDWENFYIIVGPS